ncbi:hypothetical protein RUND412_003276 [Rhizina undulata]
MATKRIYFLVHGKVQGVWYRRFTVDTATHLGLTGWVRNAASGEVEGEAQGEEKKLATFVKELGKGPPLADVTKVDTREKELVHGEEGFVVRR